MRVHLSVSVLTLPLTSTPTNSRRSAFNQRPHRFHTRLYLAYAEYRRTRRAAEEIKVSGEGSVCEYLQSCREWKTQGSSVPREDKRGWSDVEGVCSSRASIFARCSHCRWGRALWSAGLVTTAMMRDWLRCARPSDGGAGGFRLRRCVRAGGMKKRKLRSGMGARVSELRKSRAHRAGKQCVRGACVRLVRQMKTEPCNESTSRAKN